MKADAVFEGGGLRGIGIIGALAYMEKAGYTWENTAGTSVGALIASLIAAGYSSKDLKKMLINLNFLKFLDTDKVQRFPVIGKALGFFKEKGIYSGDYLEQWIEKLLNKKNISTFKDLKKYNRPSLKIIASDITRKKLIVIPDDLKDYGIDENNFKIAKAVRMSTSIPFYFKPVELNYTLGTSYIVDGGICCNFPINIFDVTNIPKWPTIGFKLDAPKTNYTANGKTDPLSFLFDIADTMKNQSKPSWSKKENKARTIFIPVNSVDPVEFSISKEKSLALYKSGYKSAYDFLRNWDFEKYVKTYRLIDYN